MGELGSGLTLWDLVVHGQEFFILQVSRKDIRLFLNTLDLIK